MSAPLCSRLAPTPSGLIHLGNAYSFLLTWLFVRKSPEGRLHLRIDDLDGPRVNPESVEDIFRQIEWLGLDYDTGPTGPDDLERVHSQRLRLDRYQEVLTEIAGRTDRIYACRCSRSGFGGSIYPGTCRHAGISLDEAGVAWRVVVPRGERVRFFPFSGDPRTEAESVDVAREMGDFVVLRKDGLPAYQLASATDDHDLGMNFIVRGEDLLASTGAQVYLASQLGWDSLGLARYVHHPLLTEAGEPSVKLSKSRGSLSLSELRSVWRDPKPVYRGFARGLGMAEEAGESLQSLLSAFSPAVAARLDRAFRAG